MPARTIGSCKQPNIQRHQPVGVGKALSMKKLFPLTLLLMFIVQGCYESGCDHEHDNPILRGNAIESEAYQRELARMSLNAEGDMDYFFEEYANIEGQKFMVLNTFGPDFCGELHLLVADVKEGMDKPDDELGFKGAEVEDLKFELPESGYPRLVNFASIED